MIIGGGGGGGGGGGDFVEEQNINFGNGTRNFSARLLWLHIYLLFKYYFQHKAI